MALATLMEMARAAQSHQVLRPFRSYLQSQVLTAICSGLTLPALPAADSVSRTAEGAVAGLHLRPRVATNAVFVALVMVVAMAAGCGLCPPTYDFQRESPSGEFVAASYSYLCGPTPDNTRLGLRRSSEQRFKDVVTILEAPFEVDATWRDNKTLHVTFKCPTDGAGCAPQTNRYWELDVVRHWADVDIEFSIDSRLRAALGPQALARFPASSH
jgi:hypothetical protein